MKKHFMIAVTLLTAMTTEARQLDLKDISKSAFRGETMGQVSPLADGESYAQLSEDGKRIVKFSFKTGKEVGTLVDVTTVKGSKVEKLDGFLMSPDGKCMLLQTETKAIYRRSYLATYYIYTIQNNRIVPLSEGGQQQTPLFSPDGQMIAFVRENNIFLTKLLDKNDEVQVTIDGKRNEVINGIPDWVNEEEFGNNRSMVFTANGEQLVWVRYDEKAVPQVTLPLYGNSEQSEAFGYTYKYPVAGEQNARVSVWSYDIQSKKTRQLQVPMEAEDYVPRIFAMEGQPSQVAVLTLNRHQDCLRIYTVNPLSGVARQIIEEKADKYVREETYSSLQITDKHILMPSDRDGNMHLYLYTLNGQLLRQVDNGNFEVSGIYGYDERTGNAYFASHEKGTTEKQIWVAHENGKRECLTPKAGWHTATFSKNYRYFIHSWSDLNTPAVYDLCTNTGKSLATLIDNRQLNETLKEYQLGQRELFTLTTGDGVQLNGWMVKPADFDPSKRYPVVMYQYGGPGNQQVKNQWAIGMAGQGAMMEQYLCQQGFLCVCVDNRGTGGRGADFEKCTYLKLGQLEARDQVETALWLGQQPYVDQDRIAIWGWSFGGFNTLMAMSEGREVFCCGIAIAPPTSWRFYDTIYTERYMRTPQENPAGYDECPISRAEKLHGALLLCHGLADDNVHYRNTAEYTDALIKADKDYRQLVYTNRNHGISGGNTRNHLFRQCVKFLKKECQRGNR